MTLNIHTLSDLDAFLRSLATPYAAISPRRTTSADVRDRNSIDARPGPAFALSTDAQDMPVPSGAVEISREPGLARGIGRDESAGPLMGSMVTVLLGQLLEQCDCSVRLVELLLLDMLGSVVWCDIACVGVYWYGHSHNN